MGGAPWVVQEGYLRLKRPGGLSPTAALHKLQSKSKCLERYCVLYMNRKLEMFDANAKTSCIESGYVQSFSGWDGEPYGLEIRVEKAPHTQWFVAAFNRVDLEKWCKGLVAALDPEGAAGREVRRARHKARKEERRAVEEKKRRYLQWKEQQQKQAEDELRKVAAREEEVSNMTPLERVDGLGSLDDDTARILEKRRQRLQQRASAVKTVGRVNKIAFRRRMEGAAGKGEKMAPRSTPKVVDTTTRSKLRFEAPPPGQFFEAATRSARRHSASNGHAKQGENENYDEEDGDSESNLSSLSSEESRSGSRVSSSRSGPSSREVRSVSSGEMTPPIPPPPPPPLPLHPNEVESSYTHSTTDVDPIQKSNSSRSQSSRRVSGIDTDQTRMQHTLAAILNGQSAPTFANDTHVSERRSESSVSRSNSSMIDGSTGRRSTSIAANALASSEDRRAAPSMATAFAASLAAVRRDREDGIESASASSRDGRESLSQERQRLSTEGRNMFKAAVQIDQTKSQPTKPRKGLFDSSDEESDSDSDSGGLFAFRKSEPVRARPTNSREKESGANVTAAPVSRPNPTGFFEDTRSSITSSHSSAQAFKATAQPLSAQVAPVVAYDSYIMKSDGKKSVVVYTFTIQASGMTYKFSHSYHEFEEIHDRLSAHFALDVLPKFPAKHWYRNNSKPENMQKRSQEFLQYLQALVTIPSIFSNQQFRQEFYISDVPEQQSNGTAGMRGDRVIAANDQAPAHSVTISRPDTKTNGNGTSLFGLDGSESDSDLSPAPTSKRQSKRKLEPKSSITVPKVSEDPAVKTKHRERRRSVGSSKRRGSSAARLNDTPSRNDAGPIVTPVKTNITGLPPRPNPFGGGRGDLLAAIRQGKPLKSVDTNGTPTSSLSPSGGSSTPPVPLGTMPKAPSIADAISNAMAARRVHIEYEDVSEDEDSDDEWD